MGRPLEPLAVLAALALSAASLSCRYDPVPQEIIDDLGPEQGTADANHRPGQPCVVCHGPYGGVAPQMAFGGTLYAFDPDNNVIVPAPGVNVTVFDSAGDSRIACSGPSGNFYLEQQNWVDVAYPLKVRAGSVPMTSLIGRDASCGGCHRAPDPDDPERDPVTGAGRDSAGLVLVNFNDINTGLCGTGGP